jgi:arylsulfatase A-like enzyme
MIGLAGAAALVAAVVVAIPSGSGGPPNVLLITIDTLRADHLHCYGQPLPTSPNIDALAARSVVFERAVAASGYTGPAHSSIMTSRYPRRNSMGFSNGLLVLDGVDTLADAFRRGGYDTAAFVGNGMLAARSGLNRGFDVYDDELLDTEANRPMPERLAPHTVARARAWLQRQRSKPFFLWVHFQDPHGPYAPPAPYRNRFQVPAVASEPTLPVLADNSGRGGIPLYQLVDGPRRMNDYRSRYAGEIAYMDQFVGELLAAVEQQGSTVVILTADHGESFGENGFYFVHGHSAAPDLSHVPLIVSAPGLRAERRADLVGHVDVMPTLLELAELPHPPGVEGIALGPLLRDRRTLPARAVFCDIGYEVGTYVADSFMLAATREEKTWALAEFYQSGQADRERGVAGPERLTVTRTFRWHGTPTWSVRPPDQELIDHLASYLADHDVAGEAVPLSPSDRERMRWLGYESP